MFKDGSCFSDFLLFSVSYLFSTSNALISGDDAFPSKQVSFIKALIYRVDFPNFRKVGTINQCFSLRKLMKCYGSLAAYM